MIPRAPSSRDRRSALIVVRPGREPWAASVQSLLNLAALCLAAIFMAPSAFAQATPTPTPGPAVQLVMEVPSTATVGVPVSVTVIALDAYNSIATGYSGTVDFITGDLSAIYSASSTVTNGTGGWA
jgi:hypothetical protein